MDVSPRLLEQFLVLAEEQHFRRAAERLSMSQPPLTQAINRLEKVIGVRLLERSTRRVTLTPAGVAFAVDARHLLDAQQSAVERAHRIDSGAEGVLRLGFVTSVSYRLLPDLVRLLHTHLPGVRLHLHQNNSGEMTDMVRQRRLDVALIRAPVLDSHELDISMLEDERFALAVPSDGSLASETSVSLSDLREEPFALPSGADMPGLAEAVYSYCRQAGFEPRDGGRATTLPGLIALVAGGGCVCLVPGGVRDATSPGITFVGLDDDRHTTQTLFVARKIHHDPVVDRVLELIRRSYSTAVSEVR
ncbi:LysR family transcriptional regulator [Rhodococcus sp. 06-235-1A]|uniref:LysR family transcriptional regulator n=1 Tax=Rhodococcus sp. 06-235-1A TaxID=2022508 RepID=UPI0015C65525